MAFIPPKSASAHSVSTPTKPHRAGGRSTKRDPAAVQDSKAMAGKVLVVLMVAAAAAVVAVVVVLAVAVAVVVLVVAGRLVVAQGSKAKASRMMALRSVTPGI